MDSNSNIILSLVGEDSVSKLKIQVFEEELKEINSKFPLSENQVDIKQTYFLKKDNTIEVGFFIRNSLKSSISIEEMPLSFQDNNGRILLSKNFNFKDYGVIPPYSARPYTINFEIDKNFNFDEHEKYIIKFGDVANFNAFSSVSTEIENIPFDIPFEEEKAIKDFANELSTLKVDEFSISLYSLAYGDNGGLSCVLLLRNGSSNIANVEKLPISIINENGLIIARKVFDDEKSQIKISPEKSKLINFEFNQYEVSKERCNLSKCKVLYQ